MKHYTKHAISPTVEWRCKVRQGIAFRFLPELVGDCAHLFAISKTQNRLFIETALETIHAAAGVYAAIIEHANTNRKKELGKIIHENYRYKEQLRIDNLEVEEVKKLDIEYAKVKERIAAGQFRDKEVRAFLDYLRRDLEKVLGFFRDMQHDPNYPEPWRIEEITRKTMRDYNRLLKISIEGEESDGNN